MAEQKSRNDNIDHHSLVAARNILRNTLDKSVALDLDLVESGKRLDGIRRRLPSLAEELRPIPDQLCTCLAVEAHIGCAVRPIDAVLKVFNAVRQLESSLYTGVAPLSGYLSTMKSLEEALGFLTSNCRLAIQWMNGTVDFLHSNGVAKDRYLVNVNKCLCILQQLQAAEERSRLHGGVLDIAFGKLEVELKRFLEDQGSAPLPESVVQELQLIIERLSSNNRLEKCINIYIEVRSITIRESLQVLDLDYLDEEFLFDEVDGIEVCIRKWRDHLHYAVNDLLENEFLLCNQIFEPRGPKVRMRCFAGITSRSGICKFLEFGMRVAEGRKSPNKLLNLLDVFSTLDGLRSNFTRLFGGDAFGDIQAMTRDLIKKVVDGSWEIFWELSYQVELQRQSPPPSDGGIPNLVSFVTDYCNVLLGNVHRPTMIQVLKIHQSWKREKYQDGLFTNQIYNVVKEIGINLDSWAKGYGDRALSYLFMMNNHNHFCSLSGTKLGDMMGETLKAHEQLRDNCAALFVKESWTKLSTALMEDDMSFSDERLRAFNEAFQGMYSKHSQWIIPEEKLREKVCKSVVEAIVPAYRRYLQRYGDSWQVRVRGNGDNSIKHSVQAMEGMLGALFQPMPRKLSGGIGSYMTDKLSNVVTDNRYSLALTAA